MPLTDDSPTSPLLAELGHLCAPERLLELIHDFVVFGRRHQEDLPVTTSTSA